MNSENNPTLPNNNPKLSYDKHLDARGLSCPLPLLKAKQCLNQINAGQVLFIQTTDSGSWNDFASYAKLSKHQLISREKHNNTLHFLLLKGE